MLENKLGLTISMDLARAEERISKKKAIELFEQGILDSLPAGRFSTLQAIHQYLLAMERSPIRDIEIKYLLRNALSDEIRSREMYMKGIDHSYYYEGYMTFKAEEL